MVGGKHRIYAATYRYLKLRRRDSGSFDPRECMLNFAPWGILERSNPASTGAATPAAVPSADTYPTGEGDDGEVGKKDTNGGPDGTDKVPRALVCQCSPHPPRIDRLRTRKYACAVVLLCICNRPSAGSQCMERGAYPLDVGAWSFASFVTMPVSDRS